MSAVPSAPPLSAPAAAPRPDPGLGPRELIALYRRQLRAGREALFQEFDRGIPVTDLVLALSQLTDQVLHEVWQHHVGDHPGVALAAVGGYGRQELQPASDLDILIRAAHVPAAEPRFLLRGRDPAAAGAVRAWASSAAQLGVPVAVIE